MLSDWIRTPRGEDQTAGSGVNAPAGAGEPGVGRLTC